MEYITFATLLILTIGAIFSLYRQTQMLQQNSYFPSRYFCWLKDSYTLEFALSAILYCAITFCISNEKGVIGLVISILLLITRIFFNIKTHKKSIKKLVFTARIKRLYITAILVLGILLFISAFTKGTLLGEICRILVVVMSVVTPVLVFVIWSITYPIEKAVSQWYINDAKRILKEHKNLTVIGVTGSYGKTTTKFILNRILSEKFNTVCTPQSFNTPMGVVRTVRTLIKP